MNHRKLNFRGDVVDLYFINSLSNDHLVSYVVDGITSATGKTLKDCINNGDLSQPNDPKKEEYALLTGNMLVKYQGLTYVVDTRQYPSRSIQEPETEKSVRGAKDGFNESLLTSAGLLRRRIRTMELTFETVSVGAENKIDVAVTYLADRVNRKVLENVRERLHSIDANNLVMSDRAIEELIFNQRYNPFPLVRYSERPDVVATHILHGYIAIVCDTSSSVMLLPTSVFELLEHVEEYHQPPLIGTFIRLLRLVAVILSIYLVPVWLLWFGRGEDHTYMWEVSAVLLVELTIELLRIATVHTPNALSNAMGMIAALLLGQFGVDLGFFSEAILLFCAVGNVCGFATPNYELSLTNKYIKIFMLVSIMLFDIYGFVIYNILIIIFLMRLKPLGVSYLYPLYPLDIKNLMNFIIRRPKENDKRR